MDMMVNPTYIPFRCSAGISDTKAPSAHSNVYSLQGLMAKLYSSHSIPLIAKEEWICKGHHVVPLCEVYE